jgi:hypothetical protein
MISTQTQPAAAPDAGEPTAIVADKASELAALAWSEDDAPPAAAKKAAAPKPEPELTGHQLGRQPEGGAADAWPRQRGHDAGYLRRSVRIGSRFRRRSRGQNVATAGRFIMTLGSEATSTSTYAAADSGALVMPGMTSGSLTASTCHRQSGHIEVTRADRG